MITLYSTVGLCWGPHYPGNANLESLEAKLRYVGRGEGDLYLPLHTNIWC